MSGDHLNLDAIEARAGQVTRLGANFDALMVRKMAAEDVPALVAEVRRLRAERDRLRSAAHTHVFDPDNYISPLRPQIRALRDAILGDEALVREHEQ